MKTKFTRGKWNISKAVNDHTIYADDGGKDIALVYEYSRAMPPEEAKANAQLVACAPDLFYALQEIRDTLFQESPEVWKAEIRKADDVLNTVTPE